MQGSTGPANSNTQETRDLFGTNQLIEGHPRGETQDADLLNIHGTNEQHLVDDVNLLDMGKVETNFDLLGGSSTNQNSFDPFQQSFPASNKSVPTTTADGTFDPFLSFASAPVSNEGSKTNTFDPFQQQNSVPSINTIKPAHIPEQNIFDPFQSSSTVSSKPKGEDEEFFDLMDSKPSQNKEADLLGVWGDNSNLGMPRSSSGVNIGMTHNQSTPNLGMPRNNSETNLNFSSQSSGFNAPRNSSMSNFASMGNAKPTLNSMGPSSGSEKFGGPMPMRPTSNIESFASNAKDDPFADLGECTQ